MKVDKLIDNLISDLIKMTEDDKIIWNSEKKPGCLNFRFESNEVQFVLRRKIEFKNYEEELSNVGLDIKNPKGTKIPQSIGDKSSELTVYSFQKKNVLVLFELVSSKLNIDLVVEPNSFPTFMEEVYNSLPKGAIRDSKINTILKLFT